VKKWRNRPRAKTTRRTGPESGDRKRRDEPDDANMCKQFFGLREDPFNVSPDHRYLFSTPQTREALDDLTYGIQARQGLRRPESHG
jgi:hypothetical protein